METDTELSVTFNRANGIDKDPKYADIFSGLQQKSLFARMGHHSSSEQISFSAGLQHRSDFLVGSTNNGPITKNEVFNESEATTQRLLRVVNFRLSLPPFAGQFSVIITTVSAGGLLAALRRIGREFNLEFEYKKPAQLGRRIANDLDVIRDAGFDIDRQRNAHTKNFEYRTSANRGK